MPNNTHDKIIWYTTDDTAAVGDTSTRAFVDKILKQNITNLKNKLGKIPPKVLYWARLRYDGYAIRGIPRGVIKMANVDAIFRITNSIKTFGDLCGGPGGFVEFILFKNKTCTGYGMTLNNSADNYCVYSPRFTAIYGPTGDGDILNSENISAFPTNLDLVIGDGGLDVRGTENAQESLHMQLYLAQIICALRCLSVGGTFVVKFFDTHTSMSVNLLYVLSTCFKKMCIYKPVSSRAANSERYIICKHKLSDVALQIQTLNTASLNNDSLSSIVINQKFYNYICERNNTLAQLQLNGLQRLILYSSETNLVTKPSFRTQWSLDKFLFERYNTRHVLGNHRGGDLNKNSTFIGTV
jgi:23S rRNA U2552 (ribose-2'-O)-methylase RlmE/FtsJ